MEVVAAGGMRDAVTGWWRRGKEHGASAAVACFSGGRRQRGFILDRREGKGVGVTTVREERCDLG